MAERALVTDTHPLLFWAAGGRRLGRRALLHFEACERRQAILYVPAAVLWEAALIVGTGRVGLGRPIRAFFEDLFSNPAYQRFALTADHLYLADELRFTRDPFDGLIVASASMALALLIGAPAAHALARRMVPGSDFILLMILATIPVQWVGIPPGIRRSMAWDGKTA